MTDPLPNLIESFDPGLDDATRLGLRATGVNPAAFVRRRLALLPPDPADASEDDVRALREIASGLSAMAEQVDREIEEALSPFRVAAEALVEKVNRDLDEADQLLQAYSQQVTLPAALRLLVTSSTIVIKQNPRTKETPAR